MTEEKREEKESKGLQIVFSTHLAKKLYLMKDQHLGCYKIGVSSNPEHRESTLSAQKPSIKLVGSWDDMAYAEKEWHQYFADQRIRGEWFDLTPTQVRFFVSRNVKKKGPPLVTA